MKLLIIQSSPASLLGPHAFTPTVTTNYSLQEKLSVLTTFFKVTSGSLILRNYLINVTATDCPAREFSHLPQTKF